MYLSLIDLIKYVIAYRLQFTFTSSMMSFIPPMKCLAHLWRLKNSKENWISFAPFFGGERKLSWVIKTWKPQHYVLNIKSLQWQICKPSPNLDQTLLHLQEIEQTTGHWSFVLAESWGFIKHKCNLHMNWELLFSSVAQIDTKHSWLQYTKTLFLAHVEVKSGTPVLWDVT